MMMNKRPMNVPAYLLAAALCIVLAYQVGASRNMMMPPTVVATVNLPRVLEGLQQRADAEVNLRTMADDIRTEQEARETDIRGLQAQGDAETDPTNRQMIDERMALATLNYQAWIRFAQDKLDVERSLLLQDLYRSIRESIRVMAETEGYDLIVVDDSEGALGWNDDSPMTREAQTLQQIRGRRVLYGSDGIDVTEQLVTRMNNAHRTATP